MKTSVTKIMMSFALMGCLIFSASDAMAQGRSRSQGGSSASRSQSAAVSRSSQSTAATMSRNTNSSSMSRSTATPQVSRTSSSSSSSMSRSTATPQVSRTSSNSSSSMSRSTTTPQVNRSSSNSSSSNRSGMSTSRSSNDRSGTALPSTSTNRSNISKPTDVGKGLKSDRTNVGSSITDNSAKGSRPNVTKGGSGKPGNIDKGGNDKGGSGKPGNIDTGDKGRKPGNGGIDRGGKGRKPGNGGIDRGGNGRGQNDNKGRKPGNDNRGRKGNNPGYNPKNRFDYSNHHYRDDFHRNYTTHSWSWNRPLPPPVRAYRPVLREWYRPVVPYGWHPYTGAPVIDRILGITFGTLFNTSIEYLYYNGYEIDGYADHVIYLRDVALINHLWDDVMLCFDGDDRLVNAQFVYHSSHIDRYRYNRIYNSLCRVYGSPITSDSRGISWFGGSCNGWITLANYEDIGHYYMTLSIGF